MAVPVATVMLAVLMQSKWLIAEGKISPALVADPAKWLHEREAFIRANAERYASRHPRLPVVYRLDEDFVAAARDRRSIEVVDDCGDALCGVATDELRDAWDVADLRAMFTPATAPRPERDAAVAAMTGTFFGQDVDAWGRDVQHLGGDDPLVTIPLQAWRLRGQRGAGSQPVQGGLRARPTFPLHGATFSLVNRIDKSTIANGSKLELQRLRGLGYDAITLIPFAGQRGVHASEVRRFAGSPASETDLSMRLAAVRAHALGMRVMLKPHVWEGMGGDPTKIEPDDWGAWFASYDRYLVHEALLARAIGAEWFCIGTELSRTESRPEWNALIAKVRAIYHGPITYAANFDAFERTPFWNQLDAVGVDSYFPLASVPDATDAALRAGAEAAMKRIDAIAARTQRPVILTELGYPTTPAPWVEPWREARGSGAVPAEQARAFAAMLGAVRAHPAVRGFFIWKYESDPARTDAEGYLPKGKPAETVIRKYL